MDGPFSKQQLASLLDEIGGTHMPFGRYGPAKYPPNGLSIHQLPLEYLHWFKCKGFPRGRLGELLEIVYQAKVDGTDEIFATLRREHTLRKPRRREFRIDQPGSPDT